MTALPAFPLFPDPLREKVLQRRDVPCSLCTQARGWIYTGPVYGQGDTEEPICPWCIHNGGAARAGFEFNDAGVGDGVNGWASEDIAWWPSARRALRRGRANHWMGCCGKPCIYLGEADSSDLLGRWAGAAPSLFVGMKWTESQKAELVRSIKRGQEPCAYVFQCQVCRSLRAYWDMP